MPIRYICLILLFTTGLKPAMGQYFEIFGRQNIDLCVFQTSGYGIETSDSLVETEWIIIPDQTANILFADVLTAQVQFLAPGSYTLIAISEGHNGNILSDSLIINVVGNFEPPTVVGCYVSDSLAGCYQVCAFSQTEILYINPGFNMQWEVTGAESYIINSSSIIITWGAGGQGKVTIHHQGGCIDSLCFDILPLPFADFSTTPAGASDTVTVCKNQEVYFENLSFNGLSYTWSFGGGEQSTGYDATHTFAEEGFYTVTLTANSICDCSDEKQIVIEVLPSPAPTLDCINAICPETRQHYTATPTGCATYNWSVSSNGTIVNGGGPTDDFIEVIWHEGPDGIVQLSVDGCSGTFCSFVNTFRIPIVTPDGPLEGDASVCSGEITTYTAPYFPGTQYQWQIGPSGVILGGHNTNGITVRWADANVTTSSFVEVQYSNCFLECAGEDMMNVIIAPEIKLTGDVQVCENATASVIAEAGFNIFSPVNVNWHIENASGQIVYTAPGQSSLFTHTFNYPPGEYTWVATNISSAYCTEDIRLTIFVSGIPDVPLGILGEQKICPGEPYGYTIVGAGNFATLWTVTDGASTSNYAGQTFQHVFGPTPPYVVQAIHADIQFQACLSDPVSIVLGTAADLVISGPDDGCFNGIDSFTTSYISGADYTWEVIPAGYGEIKLSNLNTVKVFWTQAGVATLRLHACGVTIDKPVLIHPKPAFNLVGPMIACANELVTLTTDQTLFTHVWINSNEDVISTLNNIQLSPGSYGVEITDGFGCTNDKSFRINSYPTPKVHLSTAFEDHFCTAVPGDVQIVANTDGGDYTYTWYVDGVDVGPGGPVFIVTEFGTYHVVVTNEYGCTATSQTITFFDCCPPLICGLAIPGLPGGCAVLPYDFGINEIETECNVHQFTPDLTGIVPGSAFWVIRSVSEGNIAVINTDVLDYTYQKPGYYTVIIFALLDGFVYDPTVCGHVQYLKDTVRAVADFSTKGLCASEEFTFEDLTTFLPNETIASWNWNFGDLGSGALNVSTDKDPTHQFSAAGTFEVTLTVTLASGCNTSYKKQVAVSGGPVLSPVYETIFCENEALAFELPGDAYDIVWDFGDPASGSQNMAVTDSVFHTFDAPGFYTITVAASDIDNCRNQATFLEEIMPNTLAGLITVDPATPICFGDTATLTSPPGGVTWAWSNGDTTSQILVTESNQFNVLIYDQYFCSYSPPPVFVQVSPAPVVTIQAHEITGPGIYGPWEYPLQICAGTEFEIQAFSTGLVHYHWSSSDTTQVISFTYEGGNLPGPGIYEYTIIVEDLTTGCFSDEYSIEIEVIELPDIPVIDLTSGSGCGFNQNVLQVVNVQAGINYYWSDGQEGSVITTSSAGHFNVIAVNSHGCSSQSNTIEILPSAPVDKIPGGCFVECDPLTVCLPPISPVTSYTIFHNGSLYLTGTTWPADFIVTQDGTYTIAVTTPNGCTATSEPLDILLYPGVGNITVLTYFDTDGDGTISAGDALLPNIPVQITSANNLHTGMTFTNPGGHFVFEDFPSSTYTALFNQALLSPQYKIVIDSAQGQIVNCEDSIVVSLLLTQNCTLSGPDQLFESCPGDLVMIGDSTWTDTGIYTMHLLSALGCDSVFQVEIIAPDSLEIGTTVWVDVDHNGVVSPGDTVIQGITIVIDRMIGQAPYTDLTDANGYASDLYPSGPYLVSVDSLLLPADLEVLYGVDFVADTICGVVSFNFLLTAACANVMVIQQAALCPGDSLNIAGQWITTAGLYSFVIQDLNTGCDTLLDVFVSLLPDLTIDNTVTWNCQDLGTIQLSIEGEEPFSITWSQGVTGDTMVTGLDEGDYSVEVSDANGCSVSDTFAIAATPGLVFDLPSTYTIALGDSVLISITGDILEPGLHFQWDHPGPSSCDTCSTTLFFPQASILLSVQITDADSCIYLLDTEIIVTSDTNSLEDQLYAPNVFSPNGDGYNDRWTLFSRMDNAYVHTLSLYDRWGTLMFSKQEFVLNTFEGWDGTFKGKFLNPGVFVYTAELTLGDGKKRNVMGDVTLVR